MIFKFNFNDVYGEKFYFFVDEYGGCGYIFFEIDDIVNLDWKVLVLYDFLGSFRYGIVILIIKIELDNLIVVLGLIFISCWEVIMC